MHFGKRRRHVKTIYTHISLHPTLRVKKGFIKGEALRLLRTKTSKRYLKRKSESSNHTFLREATRRSSFKRLSKSAIRREEINPPTKTKRKQMNLAFFHNISTISARGFSCVFFFQFASQFVCLIDSFV